MTLLKKEIKNTLKNIQNSAHLVGRVWVPGNPSGPCVVLIENKEAIDITKIFPTTTNLFESDNPIEKINGKNNLISLGNIDDIIQNTPIEERDVKKPWLLSPCDLQAIKAAGVTFVSSMLERVIEEKARGDWSAAQEIRNKISSLIGNNLSEIKPGSRDALKVKDLLIKQNLWSQYLEVGIGSDAEIFTKSQPMSSVGNGFEIGILEDSNWNNPEPEVVLAVNSKNKIIGATLGNDVNLRDYEGRSALLLGKAKDNNASCALGPFIRLFDNNFNLDNIRNSEIEVIINGLDGFKHEEIYSMKEISRDPEDLVNQCSSRSHNYPDGLMLFLGTMFTPVMDREQPGKGFTHKIGDIVTVHTKEIGSLSNRINYSHLCEPWNFGSSALLKNLVSRGVI